MMPRLDGFGLLAAIRADAILRDLPVIMLSARAGDEAKVEGLGAGADDYLTKPFSAVNCSHGSGRTSSSRGSAGSRGGPPARQRGLEAEVAKRTAERNRIWRRPTT